jgi:hypothetical protein
VSLVGLLLPSTVAALLEGLVDARLFGPVARTALPLAGFLTAGVVGSAGLTRSRQGRLAFGLGYGAAGLALSPVHTHLQGLSGFESTGIVTGVVVPAFVAAYATAGLIGGWTLAVRRHAAGGFAVGGFVGALVLLLPFFLTKAGWRPTGAVRFIVVTLSTVGAFVLPGLVGGAWTGRALDYVAPSSQPRSRSRDRS